MKEMDEHNHSWKLE
jgi:hypothetical protein